MDRVAALVDAKVRKVTKSGLHAETGMQKSVNLGSDDIHDVDSQMQKV